MEIMRQLMKNKKGQAVGLRTVGAFLIGLLTLGLIAIAIYAGASEIKSSSLFDDDPTTRSYSNSTLDNITDATTDFFTNAKTLTTILFVLLLMVLLGLMIFVVTRFGGQRGGL